jgi:hypothetical protein
LILYDTIRPLGHNFFLIQGQAGLILANLCPSINLLNQAGHFRVFPIHTCGYFSKVKEIKRLRGGLACYAAQAAAPIDAEIGKIDHLWMETNLMSVESNLTTLQMSCKSNIILERMRNFR